MEVIDNDEIAAQLLAYMARQDALFASLAALATGAALGGPQGDGRYPVAVGPGSEVLIPSNDQNRVDAARFGVRTLTGPGPFTMIAADVGKLLRVANGSATANISVVLPNLPAGAHFMFVQLGTGRLLFSAAGSSANLLHRQNYTRTAGLYAMATAVCDSVTNGVSRWILGGDLSSTAT